jgi:hypothetical protein
MSECNLLNIIQIFPPELFLKIINLEDFQSIGQISKLFNNIKFLLKQIIDFCRIEDLKINKIFCYNIKQLILVFSYLFGNKDILEYLLENGVIRNINEKFIIGSPFGDINGKFWGL